MRGGCARSRPGQSSHRSVTQSQSRVVLADMSRVSYERLVALVRERPPLYDYLHPAHCNRDVTTHMWTEIATQLNTTEAFCKTKWANLRSNFVRELRRLRPSEDGTVWSPQWPLFKPLMFLLPFLKKRGSSGSGFEEATMLTLDFQQELTKRKGDDFTTDQSKTKKMRVEDISVPAEEEENDDKLFMLSLVPKMRQLSTVENLSFRIEVQQLLLSKLSQSGEMVSEAGAVQVMLHEHDNDQTIDYEELLPVKLETEVREENI